jgi:dihydrodipicolinate synthase/N-acetylneuraminate lyase
VTVLDPDGGLVELDQRRLARYLVQSGRGADVVFVMGTTGESKRLRADVRARATAVVVEEVLAAQTRIPDSAGTVEVWAGVTAPTARETLEALDWALHVGAHGAVVAPLAIPDVADPVRFLVRDVADLLDARDRRIPVYLYDNPEIAVGKQRYLHTRWVKQLSRLDFVRGIKVSAPPRRLGHYTKAASRFRDLGDFAIYVGNALYILEMMRPREGWLGMLAERFNRFLLHDMLPAGVVAGPANLFPREWQRAWQVACAGDIERMAELSGLFARFRESYTTTGGSRSIAAIKRGLMHLGVIEHGAVASGTKAMDAEHARRFDAELSALREELAKRLPERWISSPREADAPGGPPSAGGAAAHAAAALPKAVV